MPSLPSRSVRRDSGRLHCRQFGDNVRCGALAVGLHQFYCGADGNLSIEKVTGQLHDVRLQESG